LAYSLRMKPGDKFFVLTPKGAEELRGRSPKLDAHERNILSLIDQGTAAAETILQRSKSTRDEVIEGLRLLLSSGFIASSTGDASAPAAPPAPAPSVADSISERLKFKPGISPSQARFALSNFCLDQFGTEGQDLADAVGFCTDVDSLQMALDNIRTEVKRLFPERRPALVACVREINETDY
jgi:hypothetical protein